MDTAGEFNDGGDDDGEDAVLLAISEKKEAVEGPGWSF